MYDMPEEIEVEADGDLRIIRLNRPDALNAVNDVCTSGWRGCGRGSTKTAPRVQR